VRAGLVAPAELQSYSASSFHPLWYPSEAKLLSARKGGNWKVALARYLRESSLVPNRWLADQLNMGTPKSVSSRVSSHRAAKQSRGSPWNKLKKLEILD